MGILNDLYNQTRLCNKNDHKEEDAPEKKPANKDTGKEKEEKK